MKARASNLVIGATTLAVTAVAFMGFLGFRKIHAIQQRSPIRIVFEGSAAGVVKGGSVNFDGVQAGEVVSIKLDGPRKIVALALLDNSAPIRKDTAVGLEAQGLTGVMAISLTGGDPAAPPVPLDQDGIPTLSADLSDAQSIRDTLHNVDHILVDNRDGIKDALLGFENYTATLAGKGDEIDGIMRKVDTAFASF
ncbi:MAG: MlaD family protein, partial [Bradyrhizobium sp.]